MTSKFLRSLVGTTALATLLAATSTAAAQDSDDRTITLGQVGLSFYAVVGGVVQELLERQGYAVEVVEGPHSEIFPQLGAGEVDLLAAAWLPSGHSALYEPVRDVTFELAPIYENAAFFWVVPAYVPEEDVASIADLTKPEVAERMPDRIVSLPEATGLTAGGRRVMEAYGLEDAGYELVAAPPAEWLGAFRDAIEAEAWVVFPLWQPQWVNAVYDIRALAEPQNAYGDPDTAYLIGHETLPAKLDEATLRLLSTIRFEVDDVTEMDRLMNVEGMSARDAARSWMEANPEDVEAWSTS
ncbi:MAG: glycine betaine ABC transporter substrate-binding protein [Pseudomonadota bacterium]